MRVRLIAVAVCTLALALACSGGDDGEEAATPAPASPTAATTRSPTNTPSDASPTIAPEDILSLPGLTADEVIDASESRGLNCEEPVERRGLTEWVCTGAVIDANFRISMLGLSPEEIRSVEATSTTLSGDLTSTRAFLSAVATLPYDDFEPLSSRTWLETNLAAGGETEIRSARFKVSGTSLVKTLKISAVGAPD